jgi:hypothetical protein
MNGNSEPTVDRQESKKAYETPQLVAYGSVAEITQSGATVSANDGQTHRARRP